MSADKNSKKYEAVDASPVKSFFVEMLTRDISLPDAILDLLDNCVDGILRETEGKGGEKPYQGYWAEIEFNDKAFSIKDNCGGIPWKLHAYAFRMGRAASRPDQVKGTVGTYGIGMKLALFKIGTHCTIETQSNQDHYSIEITPAWIATQDNWDIPVEAGKGKLKDDGTIISVTTLRDSISQQWREPSRAIFKSDLERKVATHYAFIIDKGFRVKINGTTVTPRPTQLAFTEADSNGHRRRGTSIRPYIYRAKIGSVDVFLAVGFTRPIPSQEDVASEQADAKYSSLDAGWTIICNDRAVVYCDRTELTGWGEAGVPQYHTQFIAISGIVEFRSAEAADLPMTTTKRGIDASSTLYLKVKNKMREGVSLFTNYTNKWKGRAEESKRQMDRTTAMPFAELKKTAGTLQFQKVSAGSIEGEQYRPRLPLPDSHDVPDAVTISFKRSNEKVREVAEYLIKKPTERPSKVGEACFDHILKESRK